MSQPMTALKNLLRAYQSKRYHIYTRYRFDRFKTGSTLSCERLEQRLMLFGQDLSWIARAGGDFGSPNAWDLGNSPELRTAVFDVNAVDGQGGGAYTVTFLNPPPNPSNLPGTFRTDAIRISGSDAVTFRLVRNNAPVSLATQGQTMAGFATTLTVGDGAGAPSFTQQSGLLLTGSVQVNAGTYTLNRVAAINGLEGARLSSKGNVLVAQPARVNVQNGSRIVNDENDVDSQTSTISGMAD